ncbi:MAG: L-rhamnose mutarotase [Variovorax sp.]
MTMRHAWTMKLKPGAAGEYQAMHDAIWPELLERMQAGGVRSFSIYRDGLTLFAYQEIEAGDRPGLEPDAVTMRWWRALEPLMECQPDGQPLRQGLQEVFHYAAARNGGAGD